MSTETLTDAQFAVLMERAGEEELHSFAMTIWAVAWGDASDAAPQISLEPNLERFVQRVGAEYGRVLATRQVRSAPQWLKALQEE